MLRIVFEVDQEPSSDIMENEKPLYYISQTSSGCKLFTILITLKQECCDTSVQNESINKYLVMYHNMQLIGDGTGDRKELQEAQVEKQQVNGNNVYR